MNDKTNQTEAELRRALQSRAERIEPLPGSYAHLANRIGGLSASAVPWWKTPRSLSLVAAGVVLVVAIGGALFAFGGGDGPEQITVAGPGPTADADSSDFADETTPEPEATSPESPTPTPRSDDAAETAPTPESPTDETVQLWADLDTPMWPLGDPADWPTTAQDAADSFLLTIVGIDQSANLDRNTVVQASASVSFNGENGEPFGTAATVELVAGLDEDGTERWAVSQISNDEIQVDGALITGATVIPAGVGRAFEGVIRTRVVDSFGNPLVDGFVMGGGTERLPFDGSVELERSPGGIGYLVMTSEGGIDSDPVAIAVVAIELPDPGEIAPARCSAEGLDVPPADPELPEAVNATRTAIATAAVKCDWEALFDLVPDTFNASFGGGTPEELWPSQEASGDEPLRFLVEILRLPVAAPEPEAGSTFVWPSVFASEWSEVTEAEKDALRPLYSDDALASFGQFGGYIGYRIGIEPDGTWRFFVGGD